MYTRHIATTHRNDASHSALRLCLFLLAGFIDTSPAFAEPDMALLAKMQPGSGIELAIEFQGLQIERDQIKTDGRRYLTASHPATGLNLSIAMGPVQGNASSAGCLEQLHALRQGPVVSRGHDIVLTTTPALHTLEYTLHRFQGVRLDQKSMYACMVEQDVYANIHLSKVGYRPADAALFERVIRSIHLRADHRRNVAGPPAINDAAAFHRETVRYTQEHSAQAIAP